MRKYTFFPICAVFVVGFLWCFAPSAEAVPIFGKQSKQPESTMPVVTSKMKGAPSSAGSPKPASPRAGTGENTPVPARAVSSDAVEPLPVDIPASVIPKKAVATSAPASTSIKGFTKNAFAPAGSSASFGQGTQRTAILLPKSKGSAATEGGKSNESTPADSSGRPAQTLINNERLTVTGSMPSHPEDRFSVQRSPLPGARHTRSSEESSNAPEMTMAYKLNSTTSARVALNPQDETSPLYNPIVRDDRLTATGVYLDVDVQEDFQVQLGGEVRSQEQDSMHSSEDETTTGASVGIRWSF